MTRPKTSPDDAPTRADLPRRSPPAEQPAQQPGQQKAPHEDDTVRVGRMPVRAKGSGTRVLPRASDEGDTLSDALGNMLTRPSDETTFDKLSRSGTSLSITTLRDTLQFQDAQRTSSFVLLAACVAVAVASPLPFIGGDPSAKLAFGASMLITAAFCLALYVRLRKPLTYDLGRVLVVGYVCVAGAFCGIYYFGVFSPAVVVIPFGLYFFGLAHSFRGTLAVYVACAAVYALMAVPTGLGWVADRGMIKLGDLRPLEALVVIATVEVMFFATYVIARLSRRATESALEQHDRAVRVIAGRDALLHEARMDLDGVLRARGLGRFTDEVVGMYRLGEILGRGGMGEVYAASHIDSEERAAVKLLHPHALADPSGVKRFLRECELASKLKVPNVVKVLETSKPNAPIPYIAMERLHGHDLADHLRAHGRMRIRDVLQLIGDVGRGLDAAREANIVHRDIKPRNLFFAEMPGGKALWKILDFGVSKIAGEVTMTQPHIVGTPSYMAPEQATGGEVSHRTDLFALGVIAYRALTGRPAFSGDSTPAILYQVVQEMPPRPSDISVRLGGDIDLMLAIAIAKDPGDRFDSAAELSDALGKAARGRLPPMLRRRAEAILAKHPWA